MLRQMFKCFLPIVLIATCVCNAYAHETSGVIPTEREALVEFQNEHNSWDITEQHAVVGGVHTHLFFANRGAINGVKQEVFLFRRTFGTVELPEPTNQPTNQPTRQPTNQPTTPTTTIGGGGGGGPTTTVGASETATDTDTSTDTDLSTPQPATLVETSMTQGTQPGSPPEPPAPPRQPLRVTEYMVRDWAGVGGLPQWIELYNPNTEAVNLKGYTFQYATRQFANQPYKINSLKLADTADGFSIAGGGVAILATQRPRDVVVSGIEISSQVYNLSIQNVLKRGWVLMDADGEEIQRLGRRAFSALSDPVAPPHQGEARVSHSVLPSETPSEPYYYGHSNDVGSPGFYEAPAPAAPSLVIRKRVGTWASLKRTP